MALAAGIEAGVAPTFARFMRDCLHTHAESVIPSFTNPNNLSIITGRPPAVHGICGNFFYDPAAGAEVMMNDPVFLRAPTILAEFHEAGAKVAMVTAKDKLRLLLSNGLDYASGRAIAFSAERADQATRAANGIDGVLDLVGKPVPEVYSADLSEFVFAAGVKLLKEWRPDVMYLTTTDYVQHKYAPGVKEANDFYEMFDKYLAELDALGAAIVVTADHGMKPKHHADGSPNVVYVQDLMDEWLGKDAARVILPITDPYVVHHGALGSFATAYLPKGADREDIMAKLRKVEGITLVLGREEGCARFELPEDRMGDIIMISGENKTIGTSEHRHDLAALNEPLRSHGGLTEQAVPFIVNRKMPDMANAPTLRNFDAFYYAAMAAALPEQNT